MNQNEPMQMNLQLEQTTPVVCEECGNDTFTRVMFLRRASKFLTGAPQDTVTPIPTFACAKCNCVNSEFQLKVDTTEDQDPE
jgi:hypothetical protein